MKKIDYRGWPNCYLLSNKLIKLVVTTDVGPRIINFSFEQGENIFKEFDSMAGQSGGDVWRIYGGHRLWHAPEEQARTYYPDNHPVGIEALKGEVRLLQKTEPTTGIQKEIVIRLDKEEPRVKVLHRLHNRNLWDITFAPWALSVMAPGGTAIVPLPPRGTHEGNLLPTGQIVTWAYTDMTDKRWTWGQRYIVLRQDETSEAPQKVGLHVPAGWAAYYLKKQLFIKKFNHSKDCQYPDRGSCLELFTNAEILEIETLGPLTAVAPGGCVEHEEEWLLFHDVPPFKNEGGIALEVESRAGSGAF